MATGCAREPLKELARVKLAAIHLPETALRYARRRGIMAKGADLLWGGPLNPEGR
jgi:hypothetical protein